MIRQWIFGFGLFAHLLLKILRLIILTRRQRINIKVWKVKLFLTYIKDSLGRLMESEGSYLEGSQVGGFS